MLMETTIRRRRHLSAGFIGIASCVALQARAANLTHHDKAEGQRIVSTRFHGVS